QPLQAREIVDVLARAEPFVEAARVRQHPEAAAYRGGITGGVDAVDAHGAAVGPHQRVEHAQRGGLAGTVGTEQAGDLAVARAERDAVDRDDVSEGLAQAGCLDHGAAPLKSRKIGVGPKSAMQPASSAAASGLAMKSATSRGRQPRPITLWPWPLATSTRLFGSDRAICSA